MYYLHCTGSHLNNKFILFYFADLVKDTCANKWGAEIVGIRRGHTAHRYATDKGKEILKQNSLLFSQQLLQFYKTFMKHHPLLFVNSYTLCSFTYVFFLTSQAEEKVLKKVRRKIKNKVCDLLMSWVNSVSFF